MRKASFCAVRRIAPTLLRNVSVRGVVPPPLESIARPVPTCSIVPEFVITTPVDVLFQLMATVPPLVRNVPPASTVPVCVPLSVLPAVSIWPLTTVNVWARAGAQVTRYGTRKAAELISAKRRRPNNRRDITSPQQTPKQSQYRA
jgi:hypothetical protein